MNHRMASRGRGLIVASCCLAALTLTGASAHAQQELGRTRTIERYQEAVRPVREHGEVFFEFAVRAHSKLIADIPTNLTQLSEELEVVSLDLGGFYQDLYLADAVAVTQRRAIFKMTYENDRGRERTYGVILMVLRPNGILRIQVIVRDSTIDEGYFHHPWNDQRITADAPAIIENTQAWLLVTLWGYDDEMNTFLGEIEARRRVKFREISRRGEFYEVMGYVARGAGFIEPWEEELILSD